MRPNATRRDHWAQLGIGAVALLLPPLALGAALYSMLAPPDGEVKGAAATQTTNLLLGFALCEATGLFGLVIALIILFT